MLISILMVSLVVVFLISGCTQQPPTDTTGTGDKDSQTSDDSPVDTGSTDSGQEITDNVNTEINEVDSMQDDLNDSELDNMMDDIAHIDW